MIKLDTEKMEYISSLSSEIDSKIGDSASLLVSITEHEDWCCKEREMINQRISEIRSDAVELQNDISQVKSTIQNIISMINQCENTLTDSYQGFEKNFSETICINQVGDSTINKIIDMRTVKLRNINELTAYEKFNFFDVNRIIRFY